MVFLTTLSNNRSRAGNTQITITNDNTVPRPNSIPNSEIIGLVDVKDNINPAVDNMKAEVRITPKLLSIVTLMASFFDNTSLFAR